MNIEAFFKISYGLYVVGAAMDNNITPKAATWTSGDYYIVVKTKDSFGGNWTFSSHYPITIN